MTFFVSNYEIIVYICETNKIIMKEKKISREMRIASLEVGETICFPIAIFPNIRSQVARIRIVKNINIKASLNKEQKRVEVTRIS